MNLRHGSVPFIIVGSMILALLAASLAFGDEPKVTLQPTRIVDGDTIVGSVIIEASEGDSLPWELELDIRPVKVKMLRQRIRVAGVDCWERRDPRGPAAKAATDDLLKRADAIRLTPKGRDDFGRLLAEVNVYFLNGESVRLDKWLIEHGHGVPYEGR